MMFKNRGDERPPLMNAEYGCLGMEGLLNTKVRAPARQVWLARQWIYCIFFPHGI